MPVVLGNQNLKLWQLTSLTHQEQVSHSAMVTALRRRASTVTDLFPQQASTLIASDDQAEKEPRSATQPQALSELSATNE
jgi:hypothetical protein